MKYLAVFVLILLLVAPASADIGPSPSFSFSIGNAEDYPGYDFYYAGSLFPEELESANPGDSVYVYKLNTHITVYAVPKGIDVQEFVGTYFDDLVEQSVLSQEIDLPAGDTVFRITSFDSNAGTMNLVVEENIPDTPVTPFEFPFIVIGISIASLAIACERFLKKRK